MNEQANTPLCDLEQQQDDRSVDTWRDFARTLERELNEAKKQAAQADELYNHMHDYADESDQLRADLKECAEALECANRLYILEHTIAKNALVSEFLPKLQKALNNPRIQGLLTKKGTEQ